jgi:hypothetical protein
MNVQLEGTWEQAVLICFQVIFRTLDEKTSETTDTALSKACFHQHISVTNYELNDVPLRWVCYVLKLKTHAPYKTNVLDTVYCQRNI